MVTLRKIKLKLKYENVFVILYIGATLTKYFVTSNTNLLLLILNLFIDYVLGYIIYLVLKNNRTIKKEEENYHEFDKID